MRRSTLRKWSQFILIVLILIPFGTALTQADNQALSLLQPTADQALASENHIYLPFVALPELVVAISDAWIGNQDGISLSTFLPGVPVEYIVAGVNERDEIATVEFSWNQTGSCGTDLAFTKSLVIDPGIWVDVIPATSPDCTGIFTATAQITGDNISSSQTVNFRVNIASVVLSDHQGFDRCNMPSISDMQTWWDSSPYYVANVYLGGVSYDNTKGCSNDNIDVNWMQTVADQGWTFLLAWVGPQSPCSGYSYKMSYDPAISRLQGREEAEAALQAAAEIGLASSIIIHYDVEGYGNEFNSACRNAVDAFMLGWTERLHQLGASSGAYGSPCNSHISDWANNNPSPDDIWIAAWLGYKYDPFATVWDVSCLSNDLWTDHQRARQYAGDHTETWGGVSLRIDSNVHDGKVVSLTAPDAVGQAVEVGAETVNPQSSPQQSSPALRDLGLLSSEWGWVLEGDNLLLTQDGGTHWVDRTPPGTAGILDVHFLDAAQGWLVHRSGGELKLRTTADGGISWHAVPLPITGEEIASASLQFSDEHTGNLALEIATGSSFHQSRALTTWDGGQTWQIGETLSKSIDESLQALLPAGGNLPEGAISVEWVDGETAWALAQQGTCQGTKTPVGHLNPSGALPWTCTLDTQLWRTQDGGQSWQEITPD